MTPSPHNTIRQQDDSSFVVVRVRFSVARMIREVFVTSLLTYLVFTIIDKLIPEFVSQQFNMEILLGVVFITGIVSIVLLEREPPAADIRTTPRSTWSIVSIVALGIIATVLVWLKTARLGWMSLPVALLSGITVVVLSTLLLKDDENGEQHTS